MPSTLTDRYMRGGLCRGITASIRNAAASCQPRSAMRKAFCCRGQLQAGAAFTDFGSHVPRDSAARWDARPADDLVASVVDHLLEVTLVFVFIFVRSRLSGSSHEGLNLLDRDGPIFVGIHRLEDFFVSGLKFLQ